MHIPAEKETNTQSRAASNAPIQKNNTGRTDRRTLITTLQQMHTPEQPAAAQTAQR